MVAGWQDVVERRAAPHLRHQGLRHPARRAGPHAAGRRARPHVGRALTTARAWPAGDLGRALSGGFHGAWDTNTGGYIWKAHQSGAEDVLLDLLPRRLLPIAEQLLGVDMVQAPTSEDCAVFFAADGDVQGAGPAEQGPIRPWLGRVVALSYHSPTSIRNR